MIYLDLFLGFLKVGCFAFGGAYGAIPLIREVVLDYGWLTEAALADMIAVSESTPGPIMVNLATYVGSSQAGLPGAALATLAVVLPAFCIIRLIASAMELVTRNPAVQAILQGLKSCITGIVLAVGVEMVAQNLFPGGAIDGKAVALTLALGTVFFGAKPLTGKKLSPLWLMALAALAGVLVYGM